MDSSTETKGPKVWIIVVPIVVLFIIVALIILGGTVWWKRRSLGSQCGCTKEADERRGNNGALSEIRLYSTELLISVPCRI